jgi:ATP-dependent DNA ligase
MSSEVTKPRAGGAKATAVPPKFRPFQLGTLRWEARVIRWVEPRLVADAAYTEITPDVQVRHASFKGIRLRPEP